MCLLHILIWTLAHVVFKAQIKPLYYTKILLNRTLLLNSSDSFTFLPSPKTLLFDL